MGHPRAKKDWGQLPFLALKIPNGFSPCRGTVFSFSQNHDPNLVELQSLVSQGGSRLASGSSSGLTFESTTFNPMLKIEKIA